MARVLIDCHMFSSGWFGPILNELQSMDGVIFIYSEEVKLQSEYEKVRIALQFIKIMKDKGRVIEVDSIATKLRRETIEAQELWTSCSSCDDSHIFAVVYESRLKYVFSKDKRIASCRNVINRVLDNRYCQFIVVSSDDIYRKHRHRILAA